MKLISYLLKKSAYISFLIISLTISASWPSWGMDNMEEDNTEQDNMEQDNLEVDNINKILPVEVLALIFELINMDLETYFKTLLVCKLWTTELKHEKYILNSLDIKSPMNTTGISFNDEKGKEIRAKRVLSLSVLKIENWPLEKLTGVFCTNNSNMEIRQKLFENLDWVLNQVAIALKVESPQQLASFIVAHCVINISAAAAAVIGLHEATGTARKHEIRWGKKEESEDDKKLRLGRNKNWEHAVKSTQAAVNAVVKGVIREDVWKKIHDAAYRHAQKAAVDAALNTHKNLAGCHDFDEQEWKSGSLYVVALLANSEFLKSYFLAVYDVILNELQKNSSFTLTKKEIEERIAKETWNKGFYGQIFHIELVKKITTTLAK